MATKRRQAQPKFSEGDEISMSGMVSIVHDEEYGRRRVTVGLQGYDIPVTVWDEYVDLVAKREPVKAGRRKQPLFDEAD